MLCRIRSLYALLFLLLYPILIGNVRAEASPSEQIKKDGFIVVRFAPAGTQVAANEVLSDGSKYSPTVGFGWDQDMKSQARDRGDCTGIALLDRAISLATFTLDLPDGDYLYELTSLDTQFSGCLAPMADGAPLAAPVDCPVGHKVSVTVPITSRNGKADISFAGGYGGLKNSLVSSVRITPASTDPAKWQTLKQTSVELARELKERESARIATRTALRSAYKPVEVASTALPRQTVQLCGKWLFKPSHELDKNEDPANPASDDKLWHVLSVPQFWNPIEWWIYTQGAGTSHNQLRREVERCEEFTFDYKTTKSGWYRQWIDIPESCKGKRFTLKFDAAASVAEVYFNGSRIGSHVGMFGPFECDATPHVRFGGKNLLSVYVSSGKAESSDGREIATVAVTVNVTKEMLNSLHHGCFKSGMGGIWQPVKLEITGKDRITDVFFRPRVDGAVIETSVQRTTGKPLEIKNVITDAATGKVFAREIRNLAAGTGSRMSMVNIIGQEPKLWSPEHPNLYRLKTQLLLGGKVVDERTETVGFRTFEARGNKLYLNGKPYFLRGANHPPHGITPNDKALADKFMKFMHEGNINATRFHVSMPDHAWVDAADKHGVISSVGETWPWVLINDSPMPDRQLLEIWKSEFLDLVKAYRNHPSVLIWTISNESYFEGDPDKDRCLEKYRIFSDLIKGVRKLSPDTPVVFHSGHVRNVKQYEEMLKPNGIDDSDIDDIHAYFGWYQKSPFHLDVAKEIESRSSKQRPFISQEASTGYPDNDTGHPTEMYIKNHVVPQAWVGRHAYYEARPDMFLNTHAQITKEYAEKIRRDSSIISGWMLFASVNWFRDVYNADSITPYPTYWEVKKAWQPVLMSLASPERHFEAGAKFTGDVYIVNDDPDHPMLQNLTIRWRICGKSNDCGTSGIVKAPDCRYYSKCRVPVTFKVPAVLPAERSDMTLRLELLHDDIVLSRNDYPLICTMESYCKVTDGLGLTVADSQNKVASYLEGLGVKCNKPDKVEWASLPADTSVVIAPEDCASLAAEAEAFAGFVKKGGSVLLISPQPDTLRTIPGFPADQCKVVQVSGDFVDITEPYLLAGTDPMDFHWWNADPGDVVSVCRMSYQFPDTPGVTRLAQHIQPHGYMKNKTEDVARVTSWPVFEIRVGNGRVIVSSMRLADDPVAKRFLLNLLHNLNNP